MIDMHVDGSIDSETYHLKLNEYKQTQQSLILELESLNGSSKKEISFAREVLELTREAKQLFQSSSFEEKPQIIQLFFSSLQLDHENLDLEAREPFRAAANVQDQHVWRG